MKKKLIPGGVWDFSSKINAMLGVALLVGILPMPSFYYPAMQCLVCAFSGFMAYTSYSAGMGKKNPWTWIFLAIALIFNPFSVMNLGTLLWNILYAIAGALFLFLSYRDRF